jgi:hypothetical protein
MCVCGVWVDICVCVRVLLCPTAESRCIYSKIKGREDNKQREERTERVTNERKEMTNERKDEGRNDAIESRRSGGTD